jgi:hypothetical protein
MKNPLLTFILAALSFFMATSDAIGQKLRDIPRERELERFERERFREKKGEQSESKQLDGVNTRRLSENRTDLEKLLSDDPGAFKGFRQELVSFSLHFAETRPTETKVNDWIDRHISGDLARNKFRGVLREASVFLALKAEGGYERLIWNRQGEPVQVKVDLRTIELGERIVDLIAVNKSGRVTAIEIKNADLARALRRGELTLLEQRVPVEVLAEHCTNPSSREFRELVKDIALAKQDGREVVWVVNRSPNRLSQFLEHYNITLYIIQ